MKINFFRLLIALILSCFYIAQIQAQSIADINAPKILPPSPDAAALGKYGQIPVDKSTGIPGISIPLYEIKTPRFTVPISISYHASGIKVDEGASWVGLGWSLNAGGVVTRSMVGVPDDAPGAGFLNLTSLPTAQSLFTNYHTDSSYMEQVIVNAVDSQPDNFFYNFGDKSGAFVYGTDKKPILTPYKPLKITFKPDSGSNTSYFTIVDDEGNTYVFSDRETSYSSASVSLTGASAWYLSKMISADRSDTVRFFYKADATQFTDNSYSFSQNQGPQGGQGGLWPLTHSINTSNCRQIHIDSILFKGGRVVFVPKGSRKDNGNISLDSVIVSNYDYNQKRYTRLKSFKLLTDYFYSTLNTPPAYSADTGSRYRLKLTGLSENDNNNAAVKIHQFSYNTTMLPPLHNFGQDLWGYYNGNYSNASLLQTQQVLGVNGNNWSVPYTIGGAGLGGDRSISPTNMQAGILQQITYPTKGYTVFTYEPNQYPSPSVTTYNPDASSVGVYQDTSMVAFTPSFPNPDQTTGQLTFHIHITKNTQTAFVKINQGATNVYTYNGNSGTDVDTDVPVTLTAGLQYQLMAVSDDVVDNTWSGSLPISSISTTYQVTGTVVPTNVGGLRVKSIKNYDSNGALLTTETYKYGVSESGNGDFLTSSSLMTSQSEHLYQFSTAPFTANETTYSNSSVYPLSSLSGSPVAYEQVTVYHGDTINNIGKSIYGYTITPDSIMQFQVPQVSVGLVNGYNSTTHQYSYWNNSNYSAVVQGIRPIPRLWQNGEPVSEAHYRNNGSGQYLLEQSKATSYNLFYRTAGRGLYIQFLLELFGASRGPYTTSNDFIFYDYPILTGSRLPSQTITTNYANDGATTLTKDTVQYYYDNLNHMLITRIVSYDGKGNTLLKTIKYPQDMVTAGLDPTGIYAAMSTANMISPVIQFTQSKNSTQLLQSVTSYASTNNIINPSLVQLKVMANPSETRLNYLKYDNNNGNLVTVAKAGAPPVSYIWGYKGAYPVAEVKNTPSNDIFFEGFEDGNGNSAIGDAKTGHYSHTGTYSKSLSGLDNGTYVLSYWQGSGSVWALQTSTVTVSSNTYTISLSTQVDDIRFYPASSQMVTYTYDPLIGVTSVTDVKDEATFYEYDGLQRLMNIRDKNKNIIKSFCYNYAGQVSNCYINQPSYVSAEKDTSFVCACAPNYTGSSVLYVVQAGKYSSNISQADANNQAKNDAIAEGQNYANQHGTCTPNASMTLTNSTGVGYEISYTAGITNIIREFPGSGSSTVQVPVGTYSVSIYPTGAYNNHTIGLTGYTSVVAPRATFSNVVISTSTQLTASVQ